jgi:hypothetical protein
MTLTLTGGAAVLMLVGAGAPSGLSVGSWASEPDREGVVSCVNGQAVW